jgi:UMF1 family MFS transporter
MADAAPPDQAPPADGEPAGMVARLAGLTPSGRARVPASWALYDFANTIFSYAVVSTAIGLWLTEPQNFGQDLGQLVQTICIVVSVGINALVSPPLGALSDRGGRRLPFLLFFTILTIVPAAVIGVSAAVMGAILFTIANFSYQAALIYYDATLATVSYPVTRGKLSGIGVGVGYMGTIVIALILIVLDPPVAAYFPISMALFAVFAVPIFLYVHERGTGAPAFTWADARDSFSQIGRSIDHARAVPGLGRFLLGRFFYSDAVNTIIVVMSVVAVRAMGLTEQQYLMVSVLLTVVAITASFGWGRLVDRFGPRRTLLWVLASWAVGLLIGVVALSLPGTPVGIGLFVIAGAIVGSGLGGVQVADRVFMLRLSPPARIGEFFGLYGLVGKGSQVVGQTLYGVTVFLLFGTLGNGAYQVAVLTLLGTMIIGYVLIRPVSDRWAGSADAAALDAELPAA